MKLCGMKETTQSNTTLLLNVSVTHLLKLYAEIHNNLTWETRPALKLYTFSYCQTQRDFHTRINSNDIQGGVVLGPPY